MAIKNKKQNKNTDSVIVENIPNWIMTRDEFKNLPGTIKGGKMWVHYNGKLILGSELIKVYKFEKLIKKNNSNISSKTNWVD